jgi:serine/threonine protein kinase/CheY-specific phosphatase CheX
MPSTAPADQVLAQVVRQTLALMAGMDAESGPPTGLDSSTASWSWVKVIEPSPGTLVVGMSNELAAELAVACGGSIDPMKSGEIRDAQAEFTNVVAGRLVHELVAEDCRVGLGTPKTGRGVPNVRGEGWVAGHFQVGGRWMAAFLQGDALIDPARAGRPGTATLSAVAGTPPGADTTTTRRRTTTDSVRAPATPVTGDPDATVAAPAGFHFTPPDGAVRVGPDAVDMPLRISHFRIIDHLGAGGMGMVYKAHHDTLNRMVALKVMRPDLANDGLFTTRFLREARAAANVDHPNVVPVYDAGFEDGQLFMAMRFVPGGDLASMIRTLGKLPEDKVLVLAHRCLQGLRAIHEAGMIHRDIKPANILLENDGTPRLGDLGLARPVATDDQISQTGNAPQGTPSFMSPEQARAQRDIDIRSDIYSLGVTLYTALAGEPPFAGLSAYDTVAKVLYELPPHLRERHPATSAETANLIMTMMAKDAGARYQTPQDALIAVEAELQRRGQQHMLSASGQLKVPDLKPQRGDTPPTPGTAAKGKEPQSNWLKKLFGPGKKTDKE